MSTLRPTPPTRSRWVTVIFLSLIAFTLMRTLSYYAGQWHRQVTYSELYRIVQDNPTTHGITEAKLKDDRLEGPMSDGTGFFTPETSRAQAVAAAAFKKRTAEVADLVAKGGFWSTISTVLQGQALPTAGAAALAG